ncbi:MAG: AbrB/MazE/SpoVT family DNA-binding domain-containing protein [Thermoprotei archaeon]|nr:AbrB/MazE/SpoVT family DNA-binding domain-containing protein [Thermoprotei archaeon]
MELSKVSRKFLVNIPVKVRKALGIEIGDLLAWDIDEKRRLATIRVVKNPYKVLCGKYRDPNIVYELVEESVDELLMKEAKRCQ